PDAVSGSCGETSRRTVRGGGGALRVRRSACRGGPRMTARRVFSLRFLAFALTPAIVLLLAAETTVRLKYFFSPYGRDWTYLTTPIGRGSVLASAPPATPPAR